MRICGSWNGESNEISFFLSLYLRGRRVQTTGQKVPIISYNFNTRCNIWTRREKFIQISTNLPGIGSFFCELAFVLLLRILRKETNLHGKTSDRVRAKCIKILYNAGIRFYRAEILFCFLKFLKLYHLFHELIN